jgi:Zn finger protein HypA/HybF involved in hydrogenase expression
MHVRCPHCHHPVELVESAGLEHIDCPSCGSQFNLLGDRTTSDHMVYRRLERNRGTAGRGYRY